MASIDADRPHLCHRCHASMSQFGGTTPKCAGRPARSANFRIPSYLAERIARLYAIENEIRGRSAEEQHDLRQEKCRPVIDDLCALAAAGS